MATANQLKTLSKYLDDIEGDIECIKGHLRGDFDGHCIMRDLQHITLCAKWALANWCGKEVSDGE